MSGSAASVIASTPSSVVSAHTLRTTNRGSIVGGDPQLREIVSTIDRVARSRCTVLLGGKSGTGKELVVAALHEASDRAAGPLVVVNCGAIPANLIESELFGYVKGAFTGAHATRTGLVAAAEGGTLFLDEVADLPLPLQVKLLRLLQQREYYPIGDSRVSACDIRVVAASNRNLEEEVERGTFREDLFYRLNVVYLCLPSLRERRGDIPILAEYFLALHTARAAAPHVRGFTDEAMSLLRNADWPGNVRELENAIERAVVLANGPLVEASDLPKSLHASDELSRVGSDPVLPTQGIDLRKAVDEFENVLIRQALERTGLNKNRAAMLLGMNRTTLVEMVKRKKL